MNWCQKTWFTSNSDRLERCAWAALACAAITRGVYHDRLWGGIKLRSLGGVPRLGPGCTMIDYGVGVGVVLCYLGVTMISWGYTVINTGVCCDRRGGTTIVLGVCYARLKGVPRSTQGCVAIDWGVCYDHLGGCATITLGVCHDRLKCVLWSEE